MARVVLKQVMKRFDNNVVAVRDLNICIEDQEFVVLVGPSGSGKTTALRMIAGLEKVTAGEIYIDDRLVNDIPPKDRDIAMVFQNYALYPHMTVSENMSFALKMKKTPKNEINERVNEAAKILGIDHLLDRAPRQLSGGQRQRVALGRAIVRKPKLFLMDEPLSNLDAQLRIQMRAEISKLHQALQTTVIYVTHDQTEAMTMGNRIVVMNDGYTQQIDHPQIVYQKPNNLFVASFMGSPPMNFQEVLIEKCNEEVYLKFGKCKIELPVSLAREIENLDYLGKNVIMGIRPENIHNEPVFLESLKGNIVDAKVEVTELLGSETLLHVKIEDTEFIARVSPETQVSVGDNIKLVLDSSKIHLFDQETQKMILH